MTDLELGTVAVAGYLALAVAFGVLLVRYFIRQAGDVDKSEAAVACFCGLLWCITLPILLAGLVGYVFSGIIYQLCVYGFHRPPQRKDQ